MAQVPPRRVPRPRFLGGVGITSPSTGSSAVTDHGILTGLTDDDHTQYHNDTRGDARYSVLAHTHLEADITDLQTYALLAGAVFTGDVDVTAGGVLKVKDTGGTDFGTFSHDGTRFTFDFTNTTIVQFTGLSSSIRIEADIQARSGKSLYAMDSGNTDWGRFFHDGTDFNLALTNTTNYNITGMTTLVLSGGASLSGAIAATSANISGTITTTAATPRLSLIESDASADNGRWDILANSEALLFRVFNDAGSSGATWLTVQRTLNVTDSVTFNTDLLILQNGKSFRVRDSTNADWADWSHDGTDFNLAFTGTTDYNITGAKLVLGSGLSVAAESEFLANKTRLTNGDPILIWNQTGGAVDEKRWRILARSNQLQISTLNDAETVTSAVITVDRTGSTPTLLRMFTDVKIDGKVGFHAATAIAKPAVTGSRGGNAALASLLTHLATYGLITNSSTA